ncbi:MAG TPA: DUF748 domain-containing protein [Caulobacteraceae bacterium]
MAGLVGLYAAIGFWAAPRIIKAQVVAQIAERYHRQASLGEVRLNPFTLKLEADRFSLPDADGQPMIGFDRLTVGVAVASIWRGGPAFTEIGLEAPRLRLVRRPNGRLNIQDLVPPAKGAQASGAPPKIMIDRLAVLRGRAEVVDLERAEPFTKTFAPINFTLNNFSTVKDGAAYVLTAVSERGERLAWRGVFGLSPLASQGTFALTGVKAPPLLELAPGLLPFDVTSGELSLAGGYRFALRGKQLTLGVDVGDLRLMGAGLRARGADGDWITLPAVAVSSIHVDVPARTVRVGRIEAMGPAVSAWTERGGAINLARYAGPPHGQPPPGGKAASEPVWKVDLPDLRVTGAKVAFEDRSPASPVRLTAMPLDIAVTGLALPIAAPIQVEASTGLDGGGRLTARGAVTLDHISADLEVEATEIGLPRLQPYIDGAASLRLLSGRVSGKGRVGYAADGAARFDGAVRIDTLHTVDKVLGQDFVNWRALRLEGVSARSRPLAVKVRQVVAQEPYARVVIGPNYVTNIAMVLNPKAAAKPASPAPATDPTADEAPSSAPAAPEPATAAPPKPQPAKRDALPIEIGLVRVEQGRMDFTDMTVTPRFAAGVESLAGTIKGLSGRQDARAVVDLTGQVDRYAPVKIDGQVNYFAARSYTDVRMNFQNMELTTFSPYSGKFAGYRVNKGKLNVDLHYNIDDQKLDARHRVVINQLELGDKVDSASAVKLPVKLIVALLKDRNGVIDIPIEINGTLDDPKFRIWPLIWHVVHNLMLKIATSPFELLGKLGGGGPDLQYIDFAPGAGALDDSGRQKVAALAKALAERPTLNLEIPMPESPAVDRPVLIEARLQAEIAAAATQQPAGKRGAKAGAADLRSRRGVLEALYRQQFGAKPDISKPQAAQGGAKPDADQAAIAWLENRLRGHITVTDQDLQQLGRARAEAVQAALLGDGQINPSRIFVTTQPPLEAATAPVRMTLSLS